MTTTKQYDRLNRLTSVWSTASGAAATSLPLGRAYNYNTVSRRARATLSDGSYWVYSYDSLGQVISGERYWQDGTPVAGQQFEYGFDTIGNRTFTKAGGDASGGGLRQASYTANRLNQYSQRTVPGCVDIQGVANPTAAVTVNGSTARKGDYFSFAQGVDNSGAAQYPTNTVISTYGSTQTNRGPVYVPKTPELFAYDADGNLTNDGRWAYTWDAENRLVKMAPSGTVTAPSGSRRQLEFAYDHQGRRIWERVTNLDSFTNDGPGLPPNTTYGSEVLWYEFRAEQIVCSSGKTFEGGLFKRSYECEKEDPVAKKGPHTERVTGGKVTPAEQSYQYENTSWPVVL